jgi:transcriptional regulator NrdR family protein
LVKLNETEQANVKVIENYEKKIREKVTQEVLSAEIFEGLFTEDLRVLRNEIYARHGRVFKDTELQKTFTAMSWYQSNAAYNDAMLSETELKNLKLILEAEKNATSKLTEIEG